MPVYLLHGFRWPRAAIRIHIILQNLDDAAAEWLVAPTTTETMLENFQKLYPEQMENLPELRFIEQYDPDDLKVKSQPYAYVADFVQEVSLGADIDEVRGRGVDSATWEAITELRDKLAKDEKLAWYVVVCGDTERHVPDDSELDDYAATDALNTGVSSYANSSYGGGGGGGGGHRRRLTASGAGSSEWTANGSRATSGATSRGSSTTGDRSDRSASGKRSFRQWWSNSKGGLKKSRR